MIIKTYTPPNYTILHLTSVDFVKRSTQRVINLVQYDSGLQVIGVVLYSNSIEYSIPNNAQIRIRWGKRDGTYVFPELLGCNYKRNTIYFSLNEQMTVIPGNIDPIVEIIYNDGSAQSQSFPVRIDKNPVNNGAIKSDTEYHDYLETVMKNVQEISDKISTDYIFTPALQASEPKNDEYHVWLDTTLNSENQNGNNNTENSKDSLSFDNNFDVNDITFGN